MSQKEESKEKKGISPNSVDTLGVFTVIEKQLMLRGFERLIRCYLQYIHASRNPQLHFDCAGSQSLGVCSGCF